MPSFLCKACAPKSMFLQSGAAVKYRQTIGGSSAVYRRCVKSSAKSLSGAPDPRSPSMGMAPDACKIGQNMV